MPPPASRAARPPYRAASCAAAVLGSLLVLSACTDATAPPPTGSIAVVTRTTGINQQPEGYALSVGGGSTSRAAVEVNARVVLPDIEVGIREVELTDLPANCSVEGDPVRNVEVRADEEVEVVFDVVCIGTPPAVTGIEFPTTASSEPGSATFGYVSFSDPEGDIVMLHVRSDNSAVSAEGSFNPEIYGQTSGTFGIQNQCPAGGPPCNTGTVTLTLILEDETGLRSEPASFTFTVE